MADTKISICSSALNLLGESAIASFTEDSDKARTCAQLYDNIKESLIAMYPWAFSKKKVQLARLVTTPVSRWTYEYTMPTDRVGEAYAVFPTDAVGAQPTTNYDVQGGKLLTNYPEIWLDYQYAPNEAQMPSHFKQLLIYVLAFNYAGTVTEMDTKAAFWKETAFGSPSENMRGGFFRTAVNTDSRGRPNEAMNSDDLVAVRG
jgi:hypothetical protein